MKKTIVSVSTAAMLAAVLVGCGGETPKPAEPAEATFACKQENVLAPRWTCTPSLEGAYAGLGIAQKSAAGMGHMRKVALMNGRSDLAQQIQVKVKARIKGFTQTSGAGASETVDEMTQAVDDQMAKVDLSASKQVDAWTAPSGALYALVAIPSEDIDKKVNDTVRTSLKNDDALWQQFQASKAFDALDSALAE